MKLYHVALMAFGLSVVFLFQPVLVIIAGAIVLVVYGRQEIRSSAGKVVGFAPMLFFCFVIGVAIQAIAAVFFEASFYELVIKDGFFATLKNPAAMKASAIKEVFVLLIIGCAAYLMVTAEKPQRWIFKWSIVLSIACLLFQCWNTNFGLHARSKVRRRSRLSMLSEEIMSNVDSHITTKGLALNRDTAFNEHAAVMPTVYYALEDAYLYKVENMSIERGKKVVIGSKWFHLIDQQEIYDRDTGITYLPVASYDDESRKGWLRIDKMGKDAPKKQKWIAPVTAFSPKKEMVVSDPRVPLRLPKSLQQLTSTAKPAVVKKQKVVTKSSVKATSSGWVSTGIVPRNGDKIRLYFNSADDIARLKTKVGEYAVTRFNVQGSSGNYYVTLETNGPTNNSKNEILEIGLKYGFPLVVEVQKL